MSVTLLCVSGLESLPDSRRCALLVAHFTHPYRMAALVLSRCCPGSTTLSSLLHGLSDCLPRYFLHLCYVGAYALRNSLPLVVWLRCRFVQAAIALSLIQSSVALLLMLVVGFRCVFCFDFCFSIPRSLTLDRRCFSMSLLRPSSLTGPSPCILPAGAYWVLCGR